MGLCFKPKRHFQNRKEPERISRITNTPSGREMCGFFGFGCNMVYFTPIRSSVREAMIYLGRCLTSV